VGQARQYVGEGGQILGLRRLDALQLARDAPHGLRVAGRRIAFVTQAENAQQGQSGLLPIEVPF
jgi:hypothetical protein